MCKKHWNFAITGRRWKSKLLVSVCSLFFAACVGFLYVVSEETTVQDRERSRVAEAYGKLPIRFEANEGQTDSRVQYMARGNGYNLFLTPDEAVLVMSQPKKSDIPPLGPSDVPNRGDTAAPAVLTTRLANSNGSPEISAGTELPGRSHYFVGSDPAAWRTNVKSYASVRYGSVYEGIDLVYHGNQSQLEYDFVVSPGADPEQIRLEFEGADRIEIDTDGDLILQTAAGEVRQKRPFAYQEIDGIRTQVDADFTLVAETNTASFELGAYDRSHTLVIDPVLAYSTYLGGSIFDVAQSIAVDTDGSAYVTGFTISADFPLANPYQTSKEDTLPFLSADDAFVTKLNPSGAALVYSTYLGGSNPDFSYGIAVDSDRNAYVAGETTSVDFPLKNAYESSPSPRTDGFVAKLSPSGDLVYSTYLKGSLNDRVHGIAVDSSGNAYVTGETSSFDLPARTNSKRNNFDAFVTRFDSDGSVTYTRYVGGDGSDSARGIAVDSVGHAYVTGNTNSSIGFPFASSIGFPLVNAHQNSHAGGQDAFVTKVNPDGTGLVYSTYLGGSGHDHGLGIAVDSDGSAYVTGRTLSSDFPVANAYQGSHAGTGSEDAFVAKLSPSGLALVYSTYLGGGAADIGSGIAVDSAGAAYVVGETGSSDFPALNSLQGQKDAFVTKLDASGSGVADSIYLGGTASIEFARGIAVDSAGNAFVAGQTASANFPTTSGAYQTTLAGGGFAWNAFITKLTPVTNLPPVANAGLSGTTECTSSSGAQITLDGSPSSDPNGHELSYQWKDDSNGSIVGTSAMVTLTRDRGTYNFTLTVSDGLASNTATVNITVDDTIAPATTATYPLPDSSDGTYTSDVTVELSASDACSGVQSVSYSVNGAAPTVVSGSTASVTISSEGTYELGYSSTDLKGNVESAKTLTFEISANTSAGSDVTVTPVDPATGTAPATLTFDSITEPGSTTLSISDGGEPPPSGFTISGSSAYYEITTTASFQGTITVCISRSGLTGSDRLLHFESGAWVDVTTSVSASEICGVVSSLSPFLIGKDTMPPVIGNFTPGLASLWPPDHRMVEVSFNVSATDNLDPSPACRITGVASSEPVNGLGDGDAAPDWELLGGSSVNLRAERAGNGPGRTYTVTVQCTDKSGNVSPATAAVAVPANQGSGNNNGGGGGNR